MKIFTNDIQNQSNTVTSPDEKTPKSEKAKALNRRTKFPPTEKKNISPDQIREKLAANVEMSNTAKTAMKAQNSKQFGTGFMNDKFVPPEASKIDKPKSEEVEDELSTPTLKDHVLKSDVSTNDPNDSTTTEKLKSVLQKSAFNFNPKEREVLDKILNN